jgi:predicted O-methyltransferase YrrM
MCIKGCPVPIYQDESELARLVGIYASLAPNRVLEVGSMYGGTLWYWMQYSPGATVVSVDLVVPGHDPRFGEVLAARHFWPVWARSTGCELIDLQANSNSSDTLRKVAEYGPFDFIFIDGGHDYQTARADYINYFPMLRPGGVMAFHDIAYPDGNKDGFDVGRLWRELKTEHRWQEILRERNPEGIWGIGVLWRD